MALKGRASFCFTKTKNVNLKVALKEKSGDLKAGKIFPMRTLDVSTKGWEIPHLGVEIFLKKSENFDLLVALVMVDHQSY